VEFGKLEIRPDDRVALADGCALTLTVRELELLTALAQNPNRVMTREELMGPASSTHTPASATASRPAARPFTSFSQRGHSRVTRSLPPAASLRRNAN